MGKKQTKKKRKAHTPLNPPSMGEWIQQFPPWRCRYGGEGAFWFLGYPEKRTRIRDRGWDFYGFIIRSHRMTLVASDEILTSSGRRLSDSSEWQKWMAEICHVTQRKERFQVSYVTGGIIRPLIPFSKGRSKISEYIFSSSTVATKVEWRTILFSVFSLPIRWNYIDCDTNR